MLNIESTVLASILAESRITRSSTEMRTRTRFKTTCKIKEHSVGDCQILKMRFIKCDMYCTVLYFDLHTMTVRQGLRWYYTTWRIFLQITVRGFIARSNTRIIRQKQLTPSQPPQLLHYLLQIKGRSPGGKKTSFFFSPDRRNNKCQQMEQASSH